MSDFVMKGSSVERVKTGLVAFCSFAVSSSMGEFD